MSDLWLAVRWLHLIAMAFFEALVFVLSLAIVWLGLTLAHGTS